MTLKRIIVSVFCATVCLVASAAPVKRGLWKVITLADGREVRVELRGNERIHYMSDAEGNCYVRNGDVYEQVNLADVFARKMGHRRVRRRVAESSTSDGLGRFGELSMGAVPSIGEYTIPLVLVEFADQALQPTTTKEKISRYCNEVGYSDERNAIGSVRDYFIAQSGGMFVPNFDVLGIVRLSKDYAYYGKDRQGKGDDGIDYRLDEIIADVVNAAISQLGVDFSQYAIPAADENHEAGVPMLSMIYAGQGQATSYDDDLIWPSEWDCSLDIDGVHFSSCFVGNELDGTSLMGPAIFCHEFSHALGLPDFYSESCYPFGLWSLMDYGTYYDYSGFQPVGYTAYERSYMGWLDVPEFDKEVTLSSFGTENGTNAVRISNPSHPEEYFIVEYRTPDTWYPESFGTGLLLTRFAYDSYEWENNTLNYDASQLRAMVITANGSKIGKQTANTDHLYGNGYDQISGLTFFSGEKMNYDIDITRNADGTYTLRRNPDDTAVEGVVVQPSTTGNEGIFTLDGRRVNGSQETLSHGIYVVNGRKVVK